MSNMDFKTLLHQYAKQMRSHPTDAEALLWYYLRGKRIFDVKFKRQVPLGQYIVDFIAKSKWVIIEVDGGQHHSDWDRVRDEWLKSQGYQVLRFWNDEVLTQTESVLESIRLCLSQKLPSPPAPLPHAGEGSEQAVI